MNAWMKKSLEYVRIVWVLARKDIWEGMKNRNILVLIFSVGLLIVFYKALPSLGAGNEPTHVLAYDAGKSALTVLLEESPNLTVRTQFESEEAMIDRLRENDIPELGLVIPADFDRQRKAGQTPVLQGYVMYWLDKGEAVALKDAAAAEISRLLGTPVTISIEGNTIFNVPEKDGAGGQASMAIIFALVMIGVNLVPNYMLDEKQARTLEVLMVSPASETQIAVSKAAAGLFYSGAMAALALAVNYRLVMYWGLAVAAVVLFGLLTVLLGLILGTWMETRAQFQLWAWVIILPMIMPLIVYLLGDLLPAVFGQILPVFPAATMLILLRYAYAEPITWGIPLLALGWLLLWVIAEVAVVSWILRRRDRAEKPIAAANGLAAAKPKRLEPSAGLPSAILPAAHAARPEESGPEGNTGFRAALRIVGAIAGKDVREAFRNRLFLSIMVGAFLIAANGLVLPILINWKNLPSAVIYDEGKSAVVRGLAGREDCRVSFIRSRAEMEDAVVRSFGTWVGIVVPPDFDQRTGGIDVEAEIAHWADTDKVNRSIAFFETQLGSAGLPPVRIQVGEKKLYPTAESSGVPLLNLFTQILVLVTMGFILVPLLLVEEKESRTMDMLMASPAGYRHFLAGKTLAGLTYCLCAGLVIILLNWYMVVHWEILLAAVLLASAFVVAVGLLIGTLGNTPTAAAFWGAPLMILMVASAIVKIFPGVVLPEWLNAILAWSPATLILRLFRLAIAGEAPAAQVWAAAAALGGMTLAVYIAVVLIMRRRYSV
jgi:ABC-type Na+ efflux pump permease subunit